MVICMNGFDIQRALDLIEGSIHANMETVRGEILQYLEEHGDELAAEVAKSGYCIVPTHLGPVKISQEDLEAEYA
jgi:hypothetical protein